MLARNTGRNAKAGRLKISHKPPPIKGPMKAVLYPIESVAPVRRATLPGAANKAGRARASVNTRAELAPSNAAHRYSRVAGVNIQPSIPTMQTQPARMKG